MVGACYFTASVFPRLPKSLSAGVPMCEKPRCKHECETPALLACNPECSPPRCEIRCPVRECETGKCPECRVHCHEPFCRARCPRAPTPKCRSVCEKPSCAWKCRKPYNCPRPLCKMVCEREPSCVVRAKATDAAAQPVTDTARAAVKSAVERGQDSVLSALQQIGS